MNKENCITTGSTRRRETWVSLSYAVAALVTLSVEAVEKVLKQILGRDVEKSDLIECATINDLTIMKGRETPQNQALTILKGFSTVSVEIVYHR